MTKVKICGITNLEDALLSVEYGADMLGFNFYPKSPRYLSPEEARQIVDELPSEVEKVGVFVNESMETVAATVDAAGLTLIQFHGDEDPSFIDAIKRLTKLPIIKAFRVSPDFVPEDVLRFEVDYVLLDGFYERQFGGTGRIFNWDIARRVTTFNSSVIVAGGLTSKNIVFALRESEASIVDACSGVESNPRKKDRVQLINFITKAKKERTEVENVKDVFEYLDRLHRLPSMYIGKTSLITLDNHLHGFAAAIRVTASDFDMGGIFDDFHWFIQKKFGYGRNGMSWQSIIVEGSGGDGELAVDMFFAFLEEYKLKRKQK